MFGVTLFTIVLQVLANERKDLVVSKAWGVFEIAFVVAKLAGRTKLTSVLIKVAASAAIFDTQICGECSFVETLL